MGQLLKVSLLNLWMIKQSITNVGDDQIKEDRKTNVCVCKLEYFSTTKEAASGGIFLAFEVDRLLIEMHGPISQFL